MTSKNPEEKSIKTFLVDAGINLADIVQYENARVGSNTQLLVVA